jgi:hypothetical protein
MFYKNRNALGAVLPLLAGLLFAGQLSAQTSTPVGPDFNDISGTGTEVVLGDDQVSTSIPLPFTFGFFGVDKNEIFISSNGFLAFSSGTGSGCCTGQPIPSTGQPNDIIAMYWEDLDPDSGNAGNIYYQTVGTAPSRQFIVQFQDVEHFGGAPLVTMQAKLYECTNEIELQYVDATSDGGTHTVGIENADGTAGLEIANGDVSFSNEGFLISQGGSACAPQLQSVPAFNHWSIAFLTLLMATLGLAAVRRFASS